MGMFQVNTPKQDDPTICEVYYLVSNQDKWGSSGDLTLKTKFMNNTARGDNFVSVAPNVKNVQLGYTLLAKKKVFFSQETVEEYVRNIVNNIISARSTEVNECEYRNGGCVHGSCVNTEQSHYCECKPGYVGRLCSRRDWSVEAEAPVMPDPRQAEDVVEEEDKYN